MNDSSYPFSLAFQKLRVAEEHARNHCGQMRAVIGEISAIEPTLGETGPHKLASLEEAMRQLQNEVEAPVIRIAAIGTTSSAKSSLLNFLCGAEILPTGVQEKSAGVTRIRHGGTPALVIEETEGALWQTGPCEVSSAHDICESLEAVMDHYRENVQNGVELEAPSFTVTWPIAFMEDLQLGDGFRFELLDLPGLRYSGDERNRKVIKECRDSLCIVAFGAHETDPVKQADFLEDALEQISFIGAPLERMFFLATRGDEFLLKDARHWPSNESSFLEERLAAIKEGIAERYPHADTEGLDIHTLSPQPALLCRQLGDEEKRTDAWMEVQKSYLGLVTGGRNNDPNDGVDIWLGMSAPKYTLWGDEDWKQVMAQLLETTHALDFQSALEKRLGGNLSAIILPPTCSRYRTVAEDVSQWAHSGAELARTHIRGNLERHLELLDKAMAEQEQINADARRQLEAYIDEWMELAFGATTGPASQPDLSSQESKSDFQSRWDELESKYPQFHVPELSEIGEWRVQLEAAFLRPIKSMAAKLVVDKSLPAGLPLRDRLEACCMSLKKHGYRGSKARNGMNFETPGMLQTDAAAQKKKMAELESDFELAQQICDESAVASALAICRQLMEKTVDALDKLQVMHLEFLQSQSRAMPPEMRHVARITPHGLEKFHQESLEYKRSRRTSVKGRTSEEQREVTESNLEEVDGIIAAVSNFFKYITGNATITKLKKFVRLQLKLPPISQLEADYAMEYSKFSQQQLEKLREHARKRMEEFFANIEEYQLTLFAAYKANLERASQEKLKNAEELERSLNAAVAALEECDNQLESMGKLYS